MNKSRLGEMLTYRRPAFSRTEREFVSRYIDTIPGIRADKFGNRMLIHPDSRTIIACHTDTVHTCAGRQKLNNANGIISLHANEKLSTCLGADDTAGIYACLRMIESKVPVTFIFHRQEEIGGRGSQWLADHHEKWLTGFDRCISLDRRGTQDIIESHMYGTCCSREFISGLADALDMGHGPADGSFTDSANYMHLIPECSKISVGYANEHRAIESLDTEYLEELIVRLCTVDWENLPVMRDPRDLDVWWFEEENSNFPIAK